MILKIKNINEQIEIIPGNSYEITIENSKMFFKILNELKLMDEDEIVLFDNKILDSSKNILVIYDLFSLDPNTKKVLSSNYKYVEKISNSSELFNKLININSLIIELLNQVSLEFNNSITFNDQITLVDLLETCDFKFNYDNNSFLETFISYVKALMITFNYKVVITFNIQDFINQDELKMIEKEFEYLNLTLVNFNSNKSRLNFKKLLIIDNDLCEF